MIQFNTLKITQDGKNLIINASVKNLSYYTNILIGSIVIDNQDTYSASGPSSNPIYKHSFAGKDLVTNKDIAGLKNINITVSAKELLDNNGDLNDDILYVYLIAVGVPSANTPCGMDNVNTLGVALNIRPIYNNGINYIKQVESTCEIPKDFIDFILRYKALDLALKTENYIQANKYWNKFFKNNNVVSLNTNSCGCT
nr:MAG TPA: hypothetical protein [Crassvirales sp.]